MTFETLFVEADRIAGDLFKVSSGLDANIFRIDGAAKRGALGAIQRLCHDTGIVIAESVRRLHSSKEFKHALDIDI